MTGLLHVLVLSEHVKKSLVMCLTPQVFQGSVYLRVFAHPTKTYMLRGLCTRYLSCTFRALQGTKAASNSWVVVPHSALNHKAFSTTIHKGHLTAPVPCNTTGRATEEQFTSAAAGELLPTSAGDHWYRSRLLHLYGGACTRTCTRTHTRTHTHTCAHPRTCTHTHTHAHTHTNIHTHAHTHTHTRMRT